MSTLSIPQPKPKACVACKSLNNKTVFVEFGVEVLECLRCGHIFSSYEAGQNYDQYFDRSISEEEKFWWDDAHLRMFREFGRRFLSGRSGRLLDVGAGLGYFVKFAQSFSGWDVKGYEISPPAVQYARSELGLQNVFSGRVEDSGYVPGTFDIITLWDVIEHIPDPTGFLNYLRSLLKANGILFIATPNGPIQVAKAKAKVRVFGMRANGHYLEAKDHMNLYTARSLTKVLNRAGFHSVRFTHLPPIQSVAGSRSKWAKLAKNLWFRAAQIATVLTFGRVNINNNFFAIAQ